MLPERPALSLTLATSSTHSTSAVALRRSLTKKSRTSFGGLVERGSDKNIALAAEEKENEIVAHKNKGKQVRSKKKKGRKTFMDLDVGGADSGITLQQWLDKNNVPDKVNNKGVYQLYNCPWGDAAHSDGKDKLGDAAVFTRDGHFCFSCCHWHCDKMGWEQFAKEVAS